MINSNYGKTYNNFAEHPLAPIYFKYIDILISRDLNQDVQHLLDIANSPITEENAEYLPISLHRLSKLLMKITLMSLKS